VFQLVGHHYHNKKLDENQGVVYLQKALLKNLRQEEVEIPLEQRRQGGPAAFPVKKLGIGYPVVLDAGNIDYGYELTVEDFENHDAADKKEGDKKEKTARRGPMGPMGGQPGMGMDALGGPGGAPGAVPTKKIKAPRFNFIVQFCWQAPSPDQMAKIAQEIPSGAPFVEDAAVEAAVDETAEDAADGEAAEMEEGAEEKAAGVKAAGEKAAGEKAAGEKAEEGAEETADEAQPAPAKEAGEGSAEKEPADKAPADKAPASDEAAKPQE
jgi:hypothetical protein